MILTLKSFLLQDFPDLSRFIIAFQQNIPWNSKQNHLILTNQLKLIMFPNSSVGRADDC